ncbi:ACP phosphodiesterase [Rhodocytophaga rosea]|uniref:FMN dependent NADH:quinone oxidoreductase n=1 Tax=Rhodocytophaga rosea TaxID=2704465 RepID=A0A6C0GNV2_9BACT|nr:NAD(P)H-dependent oxidoreductase [Rhodocytophaga rosea]QHT69731.1 ACP phosphodiesterase [Rhodocytophaga rosea]
MKLLNIIASPRGPKSRTLSIAREFLHTLQEKYPELIIEDLDLFKENLPDVFWGEVAAKYVLMQGGVLDKNSQISWNRILNYSKAFLEADLYLISTPMWNFSIPYKLKQYIDIIVQAGVLFKITERGVEGLVKNKKMVCITTRGNDYGEGMPMHACDFQEPYLRSIFGLVGITDITFVNAQPLDFHPSLTTARLDVAKEEARAIAATYEMPLVVSDNGVQQV